jgi:hypothetical protein
VRSLEAALEHEAGDELGRAAHDLDRAGAPEGPAHHDDGPHLTGPREVVEELLERRPRVVDDVPETGLALAAAVAAEVDDRQGPACPREQRRGGVVVGDDLPVAMKQDDHGDRARGIVDAPVEAHAGRNLQHHVARARRRGAEVGPRKEDRPGDDGVVEDREHPGRIACRAATKPLFAATARGMYTRPPGGSAAMARSNTPTLV